MADTLGITKMEHMKIILEGNKNDLNEYYRINILPIFGQDNERVKAVFVSMIKKEIEKDLKFF